MAKIIVRNQTKKTLTKDGVDYICITDIARQKNPIEPKDVVKNWLRSKNTLEYLGLWEQLNNPNFKGVEFAPPLERSGLECFYDESDSMGGTTPCCSIIKFYQLWIVRIYTLQSSL